MARLSKKHFEELAKTIRLTPGLTRARREILAENVAVTLAATNPQFDRQRFVEAATRSA
jgi:hypothetical protein